MNLRRALAIALAGVVAVFLAACGRGEGEGGQPSAPSAGQRAPQSSPAQPVAEVSDLSDGRTTRLTLDSGFLEALERLKLTPAAVGDATISEDGVATFPITGGNLPYYAPGTVSPYVQGEILHEGSGLSLTGGGTEVELTDFVVDPGASVLTGTVSADGEVVAEGAPLFSLDGGTLEPLRTNDDGTLAVLEGTSVQLKDEAADVLNDIFGVSGLAEGLEVGTAKITIDTGSGG
ncbi:MAG TPA: hypothetical protein VGV36_00785 [Solirubrobacteraceae bacterium]|nr:hypothetical protein [Solirubrobacteraceae bacterium]